MAKRKKDKKKPTSRPKSAGKKPAKKARLRPKASSKSKKAIPKKSPRKDVKKSTAPPASKKRPAAAAVVRPAKPLTKPVLSRPVVSEEPARLVTVPLPEGVRPQRLGEPNERSAHLEKLKQLFEAAPISRYLGMTLGYCENGVARVRLPFRKDFEEGHGVIHGGLIGLLGDTAGNFAVGSVSPGSTVKTVEFKLSLLAGVQGDLLAIGEVVRKGRTLATCRLEVVEGNDRVIAIGLATYALQAV
ncbi:MAG TPA: PaaI family thioesterase [Vicinamibacteria bacterium]|nr:PaaI family thioesterase [Vicinamibacteria bacterium]